MPWEILGVNGIDTDTAIQNRALNSFPQQKARGDRRSPAAIARRCERDKVLVKRLMSSAAPNGPSPTMIDVRRRKHLGRAGQFRPIYRAEPGLLLRLIRSRKGKKMAGRLSVPPSNFQISIKKAPLQWLMLHRLISCQPIAKTLQQQIQVVTKRVIARCQYRVCMEL